MYLQPPVVGDGAPGIRFFPAVLLADGEPPAQWMWPPSVSPPVLEPRCVAGAAGAAFYPRRV